MNDIWATVVGGVLALAGVGLTLWFENKRRVLEHKRWYADHFMGRKVEAFQTLHVALVDCHYTMNDYLANPPKTMVEYRDNVAPKQKAYLGAMVMASIYVSEDENKVLSKALGSFRQANKAIWLSLPDSELSPNVKSSYGDEDKNVNRRLFDDAYDEAEKLLKEKLNPESLKEMEKT